MRYGRIPLTVIGGFLGSGKTTLLNHLLSQTTERRLAVLVNDFGALNIDAELVNSQDGSTIALTNGCICCQIGDDLAAALIEVLDGPQRIDGIVIEASGVSDPWRIAQIGLADPALTLEAVIVMLDASAALEQASNPLLAETVARQLKAADLVVVNKTDLVDPVQLAEVHAKLQSAIPETPIFETVQGRLPIELAAGLGDPHVEALSRSAGLNCCKHLPGRPHSHLGEPADHGAVFDTWFYEASQTLDVRGLRQLLGQMPAGVLRLKGIVQTPEYEAAELQFAGRHGSLRPLPEHGSHARGVVAIGLRGRLPFALLEEAFARAVAKPDASCGGPALQAFQGDRVSQV